MGDRDGQAARPVRGTAGAGRDRSTGARPRVRQLPVVLCLLAALGFAGLAGAPLAGGMPAARAAATAAVLFEEGFEAGGFGAWDLVRSGADGAASVQGESTGTGGGAAHLAATTTRGSHAYIRKSLAPAPAGVTVAADFRILAEGLADSHVPLLRLFDGAGAPLVSFYRQNRAGDRLWLQHSGAYHATGGRVPLDRWVRAEVRVASRGDGTGVVEAWLDGAPIYEAATADLRTGGALRLQLGQETPGQAFALIADNVLVTGDADPGAGHPCEPGTPAPTTADPGEVLLADNFEGGDLARWTAVERSGDATVTIRSGVARGGGCAVGLRASAAPSSRANLRLALPAGTREVWASGWFAVQAEGANPRSNVPLLRLFAGDVRAFDIHRQNGSGAVAVRYPDGAGGYTYRPLGLALAQGRWHALRVHAVADGDASTIEVWIDGVAVYATAAATMGVAGFDTVLLGSEHVAQEGDLVADDIVLKRVP
jgi:hypothetical protein